MSTVAGALTQAGQREGAADLARQAIDRARTITDPDQQARALAAVACVHGASLPGGLLLAEAPLWDP